MSCCTLLQRIYVCDSRGALFQCTDVFFCVGGNKGKKECERLEATMATHKAKAKTEREALEKGDRRREKTMETKMDDGTNQHKAERRLLHLIKRILE